MKNEQIQEFFTKVAQDESFKAEILKLKEEMEAKKLNEQDVQKFVGKVLLPKAKKLGYDFSEKDLSDFGNSQEFANLAKLSLEEMENVSGGSFAATLGTIVYTLMSFLGFSGGQSVGSDLAPHVGNYKLSPVSDAVYSKFSDECAPNFGKGAPEGDCVDYSKLNTDSDLYYLPSTKDVVAVDKSSDIDIRREILKHGGVEVPRPHSQSGNDDYYWSMRNFIYGNLPIGSHVSKQGVYVNRGSALDASELSFDDGAGTGQIFYPHELAVRKWGSSYASKVEGVNPMSDDAWKDLAHQERNNPEEYEARTAYSTLPAGSRAMPGGVVVPTDPKGNYVTFYPADLARMKWGHRQDLVPSDVWDDLAATNPHVYTFPSYAKYLIEYDADGVTVPRSLFGELDSEDMAKVPHSVAAAFWGNGNNPAE